MTKQPTVSVPSEVVGAIRRALHLDLVDAHRRHGASTSAEYDLHPDVVAAVKWVHGLDDRAALDLVQEALTSATAVVDGPSLVRATLALSHGLTQSSGQSGRWTSEYADRFVSAVLVASWPRRPADSTPKGSPA
ncbi:hypothetical protein [Streptomyces sp. NBC_00989]|uniref:hypothetical protein n=1 Tax=Streptomyces sp. NBC_00989 TaxID=2903705 RepID=UPI003867DC7B|nr:hypothetical protein OG714_38265 [Streptomyces sp. NBC_00989]